MSNDLDGPEPTATLRDYDRWAQTYDHHENPMVAATAWVMDHAPLAVRDARVVELGCGTGRNVGRVLTGAPRSYLGVDGSPGMLAVARQRPEAADPRVEFALAELGAGLPVADRGADVALIVLVLEHVAALAPLCAELARIVAPGGHARIVEIHADRVAAGTVAHFKLDDGEVRFTSAAHPPAALAAALTAAGFAVTALVEHRSEGALLAAVPKLAKHAGGAVVLDVIATRA
ncbi:MAG: class I SAM-dependent methyltransferase [Deltaproteobacteria bacterium]|nr:class I SAM-dependent methyltransferase [Deltaproteobacteria bacterium]